MILCALCGHPTGDPGRLCGYHSADHQDDWARGNRLMCDLLHRGITSSTPHEVDRLERPETHRGSMHRESEASGYVDLPGYL
jgi:hypothetical protein